MRKDIPDTDEARELKELIRVKIDIEGLTQEDIEFLRNLSNQIVAERIGN